MIYLASPYTHPDQTVVLDRFNKVCKVASVLIKQGTHIFSPIAHCHPIAQFGLPTDIEFWRDYDKHMIQLSKNVIVLKLYGWEHSKGLNEEINIALNFNINIEYTEYESYL